MSICTTKFAKCILIPKYNFQGGCASLLFLTCFVNNLELSTGLAQGKNMKLKKIPYCHFKPRNYTSLHSSPPFLALFCPRDSAPPIKILIQFFNMQMGKLNLKDQ